MTADTAILFRIVMWVAIAIFLLVEALLLFAIFRNRSSEVTHARIYNNSALEIIWTIIPGLILAGIAVFAFRALQSQSDIPADTLTIEVTGQRWSWEFHYPDQNFTVENNFKVPAGQAVLLKITSDDIQHNFWIPALGDTVAALPGRETNLWFVADQKGTFVGQCARRCNSEHNNMLAEVEIVEGAAFDAWIADQKVATTTTSSGPSIIIFILTSGLLAGLLLVALLSSSGTSKARLSEQ